MGHKRTYLLLLVAVLLLLSTVGATTTHHRRTRPHRSHRAVRPVRRVAWNPMFHGSHEMLVRENEELNLLQLPRIANDDELIALEEAEELVAVEEAPGLVVAPNLVENRRYCRPWTRDFLEDLGEAYYREFHRPLMVTSLVRTVDQQKKLRRHNGNAGPEEGETASTHLTGVTVDLLKRGLTRKQHQWLEQYFLPLKNAGLIEPIEERRQPVFHVVVYKAYSDEQDEPDQPDSPPEASDPKISSSKGL